MHFSIASQLCSKANIFLYFYYDLAMLSQRENCPRISQTRTMVKIVTYVTTVDPWYVVHTLRALMSPPPQILNMMMHKKAENYIEMLTLGISQCTFNYLSDPLLPGHKIRTFQFIAM